MKTFISFIGLLFLALFSFAQPAIRQSSFRIVTPSGLAGYKNFTEIDSAASNWGTGIDSVWENMEVKFDPTNLKGCWSFPAGFFTNKFALIFRGDCEYGLKAYNAQLAGAKGVIIVNNLHGVTGMGPGVNGGVVEIPTIMVSMNDGQSIYNELQQGNPVIVSLTSWAFDPVQNTTDVGIFEMSILSPENIVNPVNQTNNIAGLQDNKFKYSSGGTVFNFGSGQIQAIQQKAVLYYSPSLLPGAIFNPIDSVERIKNYSTALTSTDSLLSLAIDSVNGSPTYFDLNNKPVGSYRITNYVSVPSSTETVESQMNNTVVREFKISDSLICNTNYDFLNEKPFSDNYLIPQINTSTEWGPLFYIRNGGIPLHRAEMIVKRSSLNDSTYNGQDVLIYIDEWTDWDGNGIINPQSELVIRGVGMVTLTSSQIIPLEGLKVSVPINDYMTGNPGPLLNSNTTYWVRWAASGTTYAIGTETKSRFEANNHYSRFGGAPLKNNGYIYMGGFIATGQPSIALVTGSASVNYPTMTYTITKQPNCFSVCNGEATVTTNGGTPPYSYQILPSSSGISINSNGLVQGLCAGTTYTIICTDASFVQDTMTMNTWVSNFYLAAVPGSISPAGCSGTCYGKFDVNIVNSAFPVTFQINPLVGVMDTISGIATSLCVGNYTVTATDNYGCTVTTNMYISASPQPNITPTILNEVSCFGDCDGEYFYSVSFGTPPYTFQINPPGATVISNGFISGLCAGVYTVSMVDSVNCATSQWLTVDQPQPLQLNVSSISAPSTISSCDGNAQISANGGTLIYVYSIQGPGTPFVGINGACSNLCSGAYTVSVTDGHGCISTNSFVVPTPTGVYQSELKTMVDLFPNPASDLLYIRSHDSESNLLQWELLDGMGGVLASGGTHDKVQVLPINSYPNGLYFIRINSNGMSATLKFTIYKE